MKKSVQMDFKPVSHEDWWKDHVQYHVLDRQGIDIVCAEFHHPHAKANVIFLTGWNESFLKYPELIKTLYSSNLSVFTYDHQSQGLSGRWLTESQSTWIHSFNDYVDDFVSFVNIITRDHPHMPIYLVAHSMGCLIAGIGMARHPTLITRAVFSAPLLRNKCGLKALNYETIILPQPVAYWVTLIVCKAGLGVLHALGFFKEKASDPITLKLTTDGDQLRLFEQLRQRYPKTISCCITNDWLVHCMNAQEQFARRYGLVRSNVLILQAAEDVFVYNRAMTIFAKTARSCRVFHMPGAYHEIFLETKIRRNAALAVTLRFFTQKTDDVTAVEPIEPLQICDDDAPMFTFSELVIRSIGGVVGVFGLALGLALLVGGRRRF